MSKPKIPKNPKAELKKLQDKWYKKIADDGFEDIENDEDHLKFYSSQFAAKFNHETWEAKATYYQMADNFLNEYKFDTELEKVIWEYHCNALSYRDIAKVLKKLRLAKKPTRTGIYNVIKKLKTKMFDMYMMHDTEYRE